MSFLTYDSSDPYDALATYDGFDLAPPPVVPNVWPVTLPLPVRNSRRQYLPRNLRTVMETGRVRVRRQSLTPFDVLHCIWNFTADQFATFKTFFEDTLTNGSEAFTMEILGEANDREVRFLDATYSFTRSDNLVSVSAALLIRPEVAPFTNGFDFWLDGVPVLTLRPGANFASWIENQVFADQKKN